MSEFQNAAADFFYGLSERRDGEGDYSVRCFNLAVNKFLDTGAKQDAFDVYFCYSEIFKPFGEGYNKSIKYLVELLCDYENSAATLSDKHRDHYSHSVYVFCLGAALYRTNKRLRELLSNNLFSDKGADWEFLQRWGAAALFHDVGYPYEIAFTNIRHLTYQLSDLPKDTKEQREAVNEAAAPIVGFKRLKEFNALGEEVSAVYKRLFNADWDFSTAEKIIAYGISRALGRSFERVCAEIASLIPEGERHMDHGYFGAVTMLKKSIAEAKDDYQYLIAAEAASAIMLHNAYARRFMDKPLGAEDGVIYYLLLLCDCMQDWDRDAFGKLSKLEPIAWNMRAELTDIRLKLNYLFEEGAEAAMRKTEQNKLCEIEEAVRIKDIFDSVEVSVAVEANSKPVRHTMSMSHFRSIIDIAVASHAKYMTLKDISSVSRSWDKLTLEYKLSNIGQAKDYAENLDRIGCFYDDRILPYERVAAFGKEELELLSRREHTRWCREKYSMGWRYGVKGRDYNADGAADREIKRLHCDLVPYDALNEDGKAKDRAAMASMIPYLKENAGINVYRFAPPISDKGITAGVSGYRNIPKGAEKEVKRAIGSALESINVSALLSGMADGADMLAAEAALDRGIALVAALPMPVAEFRNTVENKDKFDRLISLAQKVTVVPVTGGNPYSNLSHYLINKCDRLLAVWDGVSTEAKEGGTFYTRLAAIACDRDITDIII